MGIQKLPLLNRYREEDFLCNRMVVSMEGKIITVKGRD